MVSEAWKMIARENIAQDVISREYVLTFDAWIKVAYYPEQLALLSPTPRVWTSNHLQTRHCLKWLAANISRGASLVTFCHDQSQIIIQAVSDAE